MSNIRWMAWSTPDKQVVPVERGDLGRLKADPSVLLWVDVEGVDDEAQAFLLEDMGFHPMAVEDCVERVDRPKFDLYEDHAFVIFHAVDMDVLEEEHDVWTRELDLFLGDGCLVTVHRREIRSVNEVWEDATERPKSVLGRGGDDLFATVLESVSDKYALVLDQLDDQVEALDERSLTEQGAGVMVDIQAVRRRLAVLRRQVTPQRDLAGRLARGDQAVLGDERELSTIARIHMREVYDDLARVVDAVTAHRETVAGSRDLYLAMQGHRMNEIMKVLTVIATCMMPASLVAGIYGMNFAPGAGDYMPELGWKYGYFWALGLMAVLIGGMVVYFRRRGWLGGGGS